VNSDHHEVIVRRSQFAVHRSPASEFGVRGLGFGVLNSVL